MTHTGHAACTEFPRVTRRWTTQELPWTDVGDYSRAQSLLKAADERSAAIVEKSRQEEWVDRQSRAGDGTLFKGVPGRWEDVLGSYGL